MGSIVSADFKKNRLTLTFRGVVTAKEMNKLYTDVRFAVADLEDKYNVLSNFTECKFMYLNSLGTFRKMMKYILAKEIGEVVRIIESNRVVSKQILNLTLHNPGYIPVYAATLEEAEKRLGCPERRDSLRFDLHEKPITIINDTANHDGFILDISTSGCAIASKSARLETGDEIRVKFTLNAESKLELFDIKARVIRIETFSFAVKFLNLESAQRVLLWGCLVVESHGDFIPENKKSN